MIARGGGRTRGGWLGGAAAGEAPVTPERGGEPAAPGYGVGFRSVVPDTLRGLYERYCDQEARELLALMDRTALREFYRAARDAFGSTEVDDPMALARSRARAILPLPPYEVWVASYLSNRRAFLDRLGVPPVPRQAEPVTVDVRGMGAGWYAALCLSSSDGGWKGFLQFHRSEGAESRRTHTIFHGDDSEEIRDRFHAFDEHTLQAFLRSVRP